MSSLISDLQTEADEPGDASNQHATSSSNGSTDAAGVQTVGLIGVLKIPLKWSFVVAPMVALTLWFALSLSADVEAEFAAEASLLLVGPSEVLIEDPDDGEVQIGEVNPLQSLGGTLPTMARVTVLSMSNERIAEKLRSEDLSADYTISVEPRTPILRIEVVHGNPDVALSSAARIVDFVVEDLQVRQDRVDAPEANRIRAELINLRQAGPADFGGRDRVRLAIVGIGLVLSVASAFVLEGITRPWRIRRRADRSTSGQSPPHDLAKFG